MKFRGPFAFTLLLTATRITGSAQLTAPSDNLNLRFADGIVAIVENKIITVEDVRREVTPLIPQLQRDAHSEQEFDEKLEELQDSVIQDQIDKVLIVKDFHKDDKRHIPPSFVDNYIADQLNTEFDDDRSKFLSYLHSRGMTLKDYHQEVEDDIIYHYMLQQQRRSDSIVSPVRIEQFYKENKDQFYQDDSVHLRLIQLTHNDGETDSELMAKAQNILQRFRLGEKFDDLAKEYSEDSRRAKGGDWGWQKRTDLKPEFSDPLFALKKGEVTDPILRPEGCFLLYADDRKFAGIQPLDQVRAQIEDILSSQMARTSEQEWLERLRRNGYVKHF
jgi:peptidyl-prolyl cis-trans isomerase SurA